MTAKLIDGRTIAQSLRNQMALEVKNLRASGHRPPGLAVILIGDDAASVIYVRNKRVACEEVGIQSQSIVLAADCCQEEILQAIHALNADKNIDGILVQLPLPEAIDVNAVLEAIDPHKDVDGFHPYNLGRLAQRRPLLRPCTPFGIIELLKHTDVELRGSHAVVVGTSNIVGKPLILELLLTGATVTNCHRFTKDLATYVQSADVLIVAIGKTHIIKSEWIKPGAIVVDVGINRLEDGRIVGDVDFTSASERAAWITPVPGGVGPMTIAMLLHNTLLSYQLFFQK